MKETLVSFKTAELAEEKGFNEDYLVDPKMVLRPTQSLLQKYLREKYSIFIEIRHCFKDLTKYTFHVYTTWEEYMEKLKKAFKNEMPICNTYEEALEEGLYEALKLI